MPRGRPPKKYKEVEDSGEDAEGGEVPDDYIVEKVVDKRYVKGKTQYLLKWKGYPHSENTWEPMENLDCEELIKTFEDQRQKAKAEARERGNTSASSADKRRKSSFEPMDKRTRRSTTKSRYEDDDDEMKKKGVGFERGLRPERIIGATDASGELMFLMKWQDHEEADLVPAKMANVRCPQIVIRFYEDRLIWHSNPEELTAAMKN